MPDAASISAEQMKLVLDVSRLLTVTADLDLLLQRIAEAATSLVSCERASIFLHDPDTHELWTKVALGAQTIRVPVSAGIVGHVFQTNQLLHVPCPYEDTRFNRDVDKKSGFLTRNLLSAPLKNLDGQPLGVLQAVNRQGGDFNDADLTMIELLADQAGVAIQRYRFQQEVLRTAGLRHEMDLAQKVQQAMIPQHPPKVPNLDAVGWMRPASVAGGDCYDLWQMSDGRLGIFLADASGHGMAPAIVVSQTRTLVRALAEINCDPTWLLKAVNNRLANDLEMGRFVTAFVGCLSSTGQLHWSSAAQGPILLRRSRNARFEVLEPLGPPIGILPDLPCDPAGSAELSAGGMLVAMSDGVFEARSESGQIMDVERIVQLLDAAGDTTPAEVLAMVRKTVKQWQGREEPADDQTIVVVRRT
jgi:phosphoserine phosphatase